MQISAFFRAFFREPWREYAFVFLCSLGVYAWLAPHGGFPDPDSFYHAKMGALMLEQGIVRELPQLPFTTLADSFADHHFLYHVFLVPFVATFGALQGTAVAAIVLAAGAITAVHAALRAYVVRWAPALTFIVATSSGFAFRMGLAKASSVAIILLMLALMAFRGGRTRTLFFLAFVHVWSHGSWPVLWAMGGAFTFARTFAVAVEAKTGKNEGSLRVLWSSTEVRGMFAVIVGTLAGLVINPYFPANIAFYKEQIVQIAVVGHAEGVGMGLEWYPHDPGQLLFESGGIAIAVALLIFFAAALVMFDDIRRRDACLPDTREIVDLLATLLLALAFLALAFRSRRHVEYLAPFATVACGIAFTSLFARTNGAALAAHVREVFPWPKRSLETFIGYFLVAFVLLAARSLHGVDTVTQGAVVPWTKYAGVIAVLQAEATDGAVVVSSDWDDFPPLFFGDHRVRSIAGLDPMFLYRKDPALYETWQAMTTGRTARLGERAKAVFGAAYVLVEKDHAAMREIAKRDPFLLLIHEDDDASLYAVR